MLIFVKTMKLKSSKSKNKNVKNRTTINLVHYEN